MTNRYCWLLYRPRKHERFKIQTSRRTQAPWNTVVIIGSAMMFTFPNTRLKNCKPGGCVRKIQRRRAQTTGRRSQSCANKNWKLLVTKSMDSLLKSKARYLVIYRLVHVSWDVLLINDMPTMFKSLYNIHRSHRSKL